MRKSEELTFEPRDPYFMYLKASFIRNEGYENITQALTKYLGTLMAEMLKTPSIKDDMSFKNKLMWHRVLFFLHTMHTKHYNTAVKILQDTFEISRDQDSFLTKIFYFTNNIEHEEYYKYIAFIFENYYSICKIENKFYCIEILCLMYTNLYDYEKIIELSLREKELFKNFSYTYMVQQAYFFKSQKDPNVIEELVKNTNYFLKEFVNMKDEVVDISLGRLYFPYVFLNDYRKHVKDLNVIAIGFILHQELNDSITKIKDLLNYYYIKDDVKLCRFMSWSDFLRDHPENKSTWTLVNADNSNDPDEGREFLKLLDSNGIKILSDSISNYGAYREKRSRVFQRALTTRIDEEEMWRDYGCGKEGVCVVYSKNSFDFTNEKGFALNSTQIDLVPVYKVMYIEDGKTSDVLTNNLIELLITNLKACEKFIEIFESQVRVDKNLREQYSYVIYQMLEEISYLFKNSVWEKEVEYRILKTIRKKETNLVQLDTKCNDRPIQIFKSKRGNMLVKVIIGPDMKHNLEENTGIFEFSKLFKAT